MKSLARNFKWAAMVCGLAVPLASQAQYKNDWYTLDSVTLHNPGGIYKLKASAGQPLTGNSDSELYHLQLGFWSGFDENDGQSPNSSPDLNVVMNTPVGMALDGATWFVVVVVSNKGPAMATATSLSCSMKDLIITSVIPSQGTYAITATGAQCDLGNLLPGASATVTLNCTFNYSALGLPNLQETGTLTLGASVGSVETDAEPAGNITSLALVAMPLEDFGDAGVGPTCLAVGARHRIHPGFSLGNLIDAESDCQSNDDLAGLVDEDGVTFSPAPPWVPGALVSAKVTLKRPLGLPVPSAILDGWLDTDSTAGFDPAAEKVISGVTLSDGLNSVSFTVPAAATLGPTWVRFRLSEAGLSTPAGYGGAGEVEDHPVTIANDPPRVTMTSPLDGSSYNTGAAITMTANAIAFNGKTVTSVTFIDGATDFATVTTSPYTTSVSTLAAGTHVLRARVVDSFGLTAVSPAIVVVIVAPCPGSPYTWKSGVSGNWSDASNWNLPGGAVPAVPPGVNDTVNISSGSVTVDGNFTVCTLNLSGGDLTRATGQTLTVSQMMNWTGGNLMGTGTLLIDSGAVFRLNNGGYSLLAGILENAGLTVWSGSGDVRLATAVVTNRAGAIWLVQNNKTFDWDGGPVSRFDNAGTFRKVTGPAGAGTTTFDIYNVFNNYGTMDLQSGTVDFVGSLTHSSGTVNLALGAGLKIGSGPGSGAASAPFVNAGRVEWNGGTFTLNSGSSFSGPGTNVVSSGTLSVNANVTMRNLELSGGELTRATNQTLTVSQRMNWTGGDLSGTGTLLIDTAALFRLNNGGYSLLAGILETAGLVIWSGSGDVRLATAVVTNRAGATWIVENNKKFDWDGGPVSRFDNAGTFRKVTGPAGAGTTTFDIYNVFNNYGTVDLQSGTVDFVGSLTHSSGTVNLALGAWLKIGSGLGSGGASAPFVNAGRLEWNGGSFSLNSGSSFSGPGTNVVSSGNLTVNANVTMRNLELNGGELTRATNQTLTVSQLMNWTGGDLSGTGTLLIDTAALFRLNNGGYSLLAGILETAGLVIWSGSGDVRLATAVVTNRAGATWIVENNKKFDWDGGPVSRFDNAGTFRKVTGPAGAGTTTFDIYNSFNNYGTVDLQTGTVQFDAQYTQYDGLTSLCVGNINNSSPLAITGGIINGTGTISGGVTTSGSGSTSPGCSPGRLRINGNYSQAANCSLEIELGGTNAGISFDQLSVGGTATLGGKLRVNFVNDFFPAPNASFAFLTAGSRNGTFASFSYPSNDVGLQLNFSAGNAMIQVINTRPDLPVITSQIIDELAPFSLAVNATDADSPAQTLAYTLTNSPAGATVNSSGVIQWTPTEAQGPMTADITVIVTDNGTPKLSVSRTFQVTVREVNVAPQLGALNNFTVNAGQAVSFTANVTDTDLPANSLAFGLINPPVGASIDANSGLFIWRVPVSLAGRTNSVSVRVMDDGVLPLSATGSFNVTVEPLSPVVLTPLNSAADQFQFSVFGPVGPDYILQRSATLSNWINFLTNQPTSLPFTVSDATATSSNQFYRVLLAP